MRKDGIFPVEYFVIRFDPAVSEKTNDRFHVVFLAGGISAQVQVGFAGIAVLVNAPGFHLTDNQGRMGRGHQLAVLENFFEPSEYLSLPQGMQMKFDFVDEDNPGAFRDWVFSLRICDGQTPCDLPRYLRRIAFHPSGAS